MAKTCIFCGQRPESKTKEHVIPKWLIAMTGDPKRQVSFGTYNINKKPPTKLAFDQLTFPACEQCNREFSDLEGGARNVTERLLEKVPLASTDFNCLLDWLDKVRTGMWLGLLWLDGNPWGINPKFHISSRLRLHDRSVGVGWIEGRHPGINLVGPESPCFGLLPTTMCIFINELALFNSSTIGLCSRRLGFPFLRHQDSSIRNEGLMEASLEPGFERVIRPIERMGLLNRSPLCINQCSKRTWRDALRQPTTLITFAKIPMISMQGLEPYFYNAAAKSQNSSKMRATRGFQTLRFL